MYHIIIYVFPAEGNSSMKIILRRKYDIGAPIGISYILAKMPTIKIVPAITIMPTINMMRKCLNQLVLTSMSIFPFAGIQSCNILQHHSIYKINIDIYQYSIYQINMSAPPSLSVLLQACREEKGFVEQSWDSICGSWTSASHLSDNHHFHFPYLILGHFWMSFMRYVLYVVCHVKC